MFDHESLPTRFAHAALLVALLSAPGAASVAAQQQFPSGTEGSSFAITNVRVFDGTSVHERWTVLIKDGRIAATGHRVVFPKATPVVDGTGRTLFPGLIDAHTHAFDRQTLVAALNYGVTTELDQFTSAAFAATMRSEQAAGDVTDRADLFSAGTFATAPGGHGTQFGMAIPTIAEPADAAGFVAARKTEGSDWLKIIWEDGSTYDMTVASLNAESVGALIRAAEDNGLLSVVHVSTMAQALGAAEMGATGIVHAPHDRMPEATDGATLTAAGIFMAPTLTVIRSIATGKEGAIQLGDERLAAVANSTLRTTVQASFPVREKTRRAYDFAKELTRQMVAAGGMIVAGTDSPNPGTAHGMSMHRELELLVDAGLTPLAALQAATANPASVFGLDDRGRIASGARADLVLVEGDPTSDITDTRNLVAIWRNGAAVSVEGARALVAEQQAAAGRAVPVPGPISDFDDGALGSRFGMGWAPSTDEIMGGSSTVELIPEQGALTVRGEVRAGATSWAGAMFFPGAAPMSPADVSAGSGIRFKVRGEGPGLTVMLFAENLGQAPAYAGRSLSAEWTTVEIRFTEFQRVDPQGLTAIFIGVAGELGSFSMQIDDVEIY